MIGKLTGTLTDKSPPLILIDCHGVGYEVQVSMNTFYHLPATGEKIALLTHLIVREDAHLLYGFGDASERSCFRELIKISGLGPKTALSILSAMTVTELTDAISKQNAVLLTKTPGIGKKTAERLLLELKDKFSHSFTASSNPASTNNDLNDILQALLALGYSDKEAQHSLKTLPPDITVSEGIKLALKSMTK